MFKNLYQEASAPGSMLGFCLRISLFIIIVGGAASCQ